MTALARETLFWIAVAGCAIAEAAIVLSAFHGLQSEARTRGKIREAVWAILPALALVWVLIATWAEMRRVPAHEHTMAMPAANG